jgi:anti-sigma regulatory factor (Ser/Thr protein kinase)
LEAEMTWPAVQLATLAPTRTRWSWLHAAAEMAALYSGGWQEAAGSDWPSSARVATRSPEPEASSVAAARAFTLRTLRRWGEADLTDDIAAVVSELLANAVKHALPPGLGGATAARPIRLGLLDPGPCLLCAVADPSPLAPVASPEPDWLSESGRGLQVVASLASQWGFCVAPDLQGKVVWATFARQR